MTDCALYMFYTTDPSRTVGYWHGNVIEAGGSEKPSPYSFSIEAVSGEPDAIHRCDQPADGKETIPYLEEKMDEYYRANSEKYDALAKNYAIKVQIDYADQSLVSIENQYDGVDYDPNSVG